jgi:hypothetical protein
MACLRYYSKVASDRVIPQKDTPPTTRKFLFVKKIQNKHFEM